MDAHTNNTPSPSPLDLFGDPRSLAAILWGGRRLVGAGVAACLAVAGVYLLLSTRLYQASAKLMVVQHGGVPFAAGGGAPARLAGEAEDVIPTHAVLVSSPVVVRRAVASVGLENLPTLGRAAGLDAAARAVAEGLSITRPERQAQVLQISYRSKSPAEAVRVVAAVVESYQAFLEEVYARDNSQVVVLMSKARDDLNRELKGLEQRYLEFRRKTGHLVADASGKTYIGQRIDEWTRASRDAMVRAVQLKAQLELGRELAREGVGLWAIAYAMDQVATGAPGQGLAARAQALGPSAPTDYLRQLAAEQQHLADKLGPQSTRVREIQEQIAQAQAQARQARGAVEQAEVDDLLASVARGLASLEGMRGEIQKKYEGDLAEAKTLEIDLLAEANLRNELERHRTLFSTVVDQLKQAQLVGDFSGTRSHVIEAPNAAAKPVRPLTSLTLALALAAGGFLGVAAALGAEVVAPRVRSSAEVVRLLNLAVLGRVPPAPAAVAGGPAGLACRDRPRSPSAEAYRVVRANLDLARRGRDARVVLVTGPHPGAGQSALAANLAVALAQAGRKVALVDADLRAPALHAAFGLPRDRGLVQALRDLLPTSRLARPTQVPNLDLVPSGPDVPNPAELLSAPGLAGVLGRLREGYDLVVVDAPPLLGFADASVLGALADGVVLSVRLAETRRADAVRAVETLRGLGTPVLGAVVNGAPPDLTLPMNLAWPRVPSSRLGAEGPSPGPVPGAEGAATGAAAGSSGAAALEITCDPRVTAGSPPASNGPAPGRFAPGRLSVNGDGKGDLS